MKKLLLLFLLLLCGCVEPAEQKSGTILKHGEERFLVRRYRRSGPDIFEIEGKVFTDIKLNDGRVIRIWAIVGEEGEQVSLSVYPSEGKIEE